MILRNGIFLLSLVLLILWNSCDGNDHKISTCDDGEISAADAVWSHGEGDLQNSKRAPALREKDCIEGPATTPTFEWSLDLGGLGTAAAPVIGDDGTIYIVGEYPGEPKGGGLRRSGLLAVSPTGQLKWFFERRVDAGVSIGVVYNLSTVVGSDSTIYIRLFDSTFHALSPDGTVKWQYQSPSPITALPVIDKSDRIYTANDTLLCFSPDGKVLWRYALGNAENRAARIILGRSMFLVGRTRSGWHCLDYNGNHRWQYLGDFEFTTHNNVIFDEQENSYLKLNDNSIVSLDRYGNERWSGGFSGLGGISEPVLRGQYLYFTSFAQLYRMDKDTGKNPEKLTDFPRYFSPDVSPLITDDGIVLVASRYAGPFSVAHLPDNTPLIAAVSQDGIKLWEIALPGSLYNDFESYFAVTKDRRIYVASYTDISQSIGRLYCLSY